MSYITKVKKFGNSLMFILPNKVADFLEIRVEDELELKLKDGKIILSKKGMHK